MCYLLFVRKNNLRSFRSFTQFLYTGYLIFPTFFYCLKLTLVFTMGPKHSHSRHREWCVGNLVVLFTTSLSPPLLSSILPPILLLSSILLSTGCVSCPLACVFSMCLHVLLVVFVCVCLCRTVSSVLMVRCEKQSDRDHYICHSKLALIYYGKIHSRLGWCNFFHTVIPFCHHTAVYGI